MQNLWKTGVRLLNDLKMMRDNQTNEEIVVVMTFALGLALLRILAAVI